MSLCGYGACLALSAYRTLSGLAAFVGTGGLLGSAPAAPFMVGTFNRYRNGDLFAVYRCRQRRTAYAFGGYVATAERYSAAACCPIGRNAEFYGLSPFFFHLKADLSGGYLSCLADGYLHRLRRRGDRKAGYHAAVNTDIDSSVAVVGGGFRRS